MLVDVILNDSISTTNSGITDAGVVVAGSPPQWKDDSDASYVDLAGAYYGPDSPQFFCQAEAVALAQTFAHGSATSTTMRLRARLRLKCSHAGLPVPDLWITRADGVRFFPVSAPTCPTSPNWVDVDIAMTPAQVGGVWQYPENHRLHLNAATLDPPPGTADGKEIRRWTIYEARLALLLPNDGAPPCRMFPRSDGLGVGAGRNYPPAKSQQRSSRGVGYY